MRDTVPQAIQTTVGSQTADAGASTRSGRDQLRGMDYASGQAALAPTRQPPPPPASRDLLGKAAVREAIEYNGRIGLARLKLQAYQNVVGTLDDGDMGPNTVQAVARFQAKHGLDVDGKIGPRTRKTLDPLVDAPHDQPADHREDERDQGGSTPGGLSAHFTVAEFASHDGARTPASVVANLRELARELEALRAELGAPIHITSGYRSPAHNRSVSGAKNSQHLYGKAADITVGGHTPRQVKAAIERLIRAGRMQQGGVGLYASFVHYDIRGSAARW